MSWFSAARLLQAEAARERERHQALGVTRVQMEGLRQALRIFDRATLNAVISEEAANILEACARVLEAKGRQVVTPGPDGSP